MFNKTILKNGLRVVTYPMKDTKTLTLLILIATGSKYETKEINGISHLLEHMAFKGTERRPQTLDIAKELDKVGGVYNAFTGKEFMGFWVKVDSRHFDLAADVLSDMLFNSLFKAEEIEKEKRVIFEEINMIKDNPQGFVLEIWEKLLYGDQPAGWMISGERETLEKISRQDIIDYFQKYFTAENAVIALAGDFQEKDAIGKMEKFFNGFNPSKPTQKAAVKESQDSPRILLDFKETGQAHLCLGTRAFNIFQKEKYPLAVLTNLLGGIMSSRLFIKVREKEGLCYYIRTHLEHYTDTGYLVTHAGVENSNIEKAIKLILEEYKDLSQNKVPEDELKKAKDNIMGHVYLGLETSDAWASFFGLQEILEKKILSPEETLTEIEKVSADDILKIAREIFVPEKLNLAVVGPFKEEEKFRKILTI